ncbi:PQQ-binding-like beta-propeller repeat protein [Novosphingobium sp. KCTC 2891]|nr:PQQ-binding-like beta-propeller repeat protein [Novosphingobium sp. KCTC 2891]
MRSLLFISAATALAASFASFRASAAGTPGEAKTWPGQQLFADNCAGCHEGGSPKAPGVFILQQMSPSTIIDALTTGVMKDKAEHLNDGERRQIAEYLTKTDLAHYRPDPGPLRCPTARMAFDLTRPPAKVGWGYDNRRFFPTEVAGLAAKDLSRLKLKWAMAFPGAVQARSQPVVAMGAIFVGSQDGTVYALDLATGCARWTTRVSAEVRTAVVVEPWAAGSKPATNPRVFFGDLRGNVHALDALTGKELWRVRPEDHKDAVITGTPVPHDGLLYVPISSLEVGSAEDPKYPCCTFRGSVVALDMATGETRWQHYTVQGPSVVAGKSPAGTDIFAPSGAPVWGSPTVDAKRGLLYFGSGENYTSPSDGNSDAVFAVDLKTGDRRWVHQLTHHDAWNNSCMYKGHPNCPVERGPDADVAASILLVEDGTGQDILVAGAKSGKVTALDPDNPGAQLWETAVGRGSLQGGVHFGMAAEGPWVYVPIYDSKLTPLAGTYDDAGFPGVHLVDARTGAIVWRDSIQPQCHGRKFCDPGVSAVATAIPGAVVAGYLDGWLRALDRKSGKVIWETDTAGPWPTASGAVARGGSMSGPGVTLANGYLIANSGYGFAMKMPGNALLVYSVDGK